MFPSGELACNGRPVLAPAGPRWVAQGRPYSGGPGEPNAAPLGPRPETPIKYILPEKKVTHQQRVHVTIVGEKIE